MTGEKHLKKISWLRIRAVLLCALMLIFVLCTSVAVVLATTETDPREQLKARLMHQIQYEGWDPYSSDMTLEEFYALMELFDEGKLPLDKNNNANKKPANKMPAQWAGGMEGPSYDGEPSVEGDTSTTESLYVPREKFMYHGLPEKFTDIEEEETDTTLQLPYDNINGNEMYDPTDGSEWKLKEEGNPDGNLVNSVSEKEYTRGILYRDPIGGKEYYTESEYADLDEEDEEDKEIINRLVVTDVLLEVKENGEVTSNYLLVSEHYALKYVPGLDNYNRGYYRPSKDWKGVPVKGSQQRALIVMENENTDRRISGSVDQTLFQKYNGYYVRRLTIQGADIVILGLIEVEKGKYVYYYLSAEGQNSQVSNTTLTEKDKFIVEYVPEEHTIDYVVAMYDEVTSDGAFDATKMSDIVGAVNVEVGGETIQRDYVTEGVNQENSKITQDNRKISLLSIFTDNRASKTNEGAYAFNVYAPYGYTTQVYISIKMTMQLTPATGSDGTTDEYSFDVHVDHTGKEENLLTAWLTPFYNFLTENGYLSSSVSFETFKDTISNNELKWPDNGWSVSENNKDAFNDVLERIQERLSEFTLHNNGTPLGSYPDYVFEEGAESLTPNPNGALFFNWTEVFYNSNVRADRVIVAVLKPVETPKFDFSQKIKTANANGRGAVASDEWAYADPDLLDKEYTDGKDKYLKNDSSYPNVDPIDKWNWNNSTYWDNSVTMTSQNPDGTYNFNFFFQTNDGSNGYFLDTLSINGVSMQIPFRPKYQLEIGGNKYDNGQTAPWDEEHPWFTEGTLPDGAKVYVEFWMGWNKSSSTAQRHYRIRIEGAHTDVTITGFNLMQGTGANEFSIYNLEGVFADAGRDNQNVEAIEYYTAEGGGSWQRGYKSSIVVEEEKVNFFAGDVDNHYGANIRFKIIDGYGDPYYTWTSARAGEIINGTNGYPQTSAMLDSDGNFQRNRNDDVKINDVQTLNDNETYDILDNGKLDSRYIYDGGDGWYYMRVTTQEGRPIALLTIIARTKKYAVRYIPSYDYLDQNDTDNKYESPDGLIGIVPDPVNLPTYEHDEYCDSALYEAGELGQQYDDNLGYYYDLLERNVITIRTEDPRDPNMRDDEAKRDPEITKYEFVDWVLVGEDFKPVYDKEGNEIHFLRTGSMKLIDVSDYAVHVAQFSTDEQDLYVLRLMPVWKPINNPFHYDVILNWVDALGNVHAEDYSNEWDVVTEMPSDGENLYVFINKQAGKLHDWIAQHPTYTFWDDINNVAGSNQDKEGAIDQIRAALEEYFKRTGNTDIDRTIFENIVNALTGKDFYVKGANGEEDIKMEAYGGFHRMGNDIFAVWETDARICIWMFEDKGGFIFQKEVQKEPFIHDDEFYFTVTGAKVYIAEDSPPIPLNNVVYKAYPHVYDVNGKLKEVRDADAWLVTFTNGEISALSKNGVDLKEDDGSPTTYFKLKNGEGIALYVPNGTYSVVELGSKSGGSYQANVQYVGEERDDKGNWKIPDIPPNIELPDGNLWLRGSNKTVVNSDQVDNGQVKATVDFDIGETKVVRILLFTNITTSLRIEKKLTGKDIPPSYNGLDFEFIVRLKLPEKDAPLKKANGDYYFNMNVYHIVVDRGIETIVGEEREIILTQKEADDDGIWWEGEITLKANYWAVIVMQVLGEDINYEVAETNLKQLQEDYDLVPQDATFEGHAESGKQVNIVFVNVYGEINYGWLAITETGGQPNESFLYRIKSVEGSKVDVDIIVSVKGGGITYVYVPLGEYTVEEVSDWSWRYEDGTGINDTTVVNGKVTVVVTAQNSEKINAVHADYANERNDKNWVGGESSKNYQFE